VRRDTPPEWVQVMEPRRLHSLRDLSRASGVSTQTVTRLVFGESTSESTVEKVATALSLTTQQVWRLHGRTEDLQPFRLPEGADHLSPVQRAAVAAVVRAMLNPGQVGESGGDTSPTKDAPSNVTPLRGAKGPQPHKQAATRTKKDPPDRPTR
jgi:hypothetical protein